MTSHPQTQLGRASRGRRVLAIVAATGLALLIWLIATSIAHLDLTVHTGGSDTSVGPGAVIVASLVAGFAGWALLALLERLSAQPRRLWTITAVAAFVLSLAGPLAGATSTAAALVLAGMHLGVAIVLIGLLGRSRLP